MEEYLLEAREELKRLEHIIYVSLKYTRTVDVIINALNRLVSTFDLIWEVFLEKAKEEGRIDNLPKSPGLRATRVRELYSEDLELGKYLSFYTFLKLILNSPHKRRQEYRRHVTYIVEQENSTVEIKIDNLMNCEKYIHRFYHHAWISIMGKPEHEEDEF
jgi:hypothetical protein